MPEKSRINEAEWELLRTFDEFEISLPKGSLIKGPFKADVNGLFPKDEEVLSLQKQLEDREITEELFRIRINEKVLELTRKTRELQLQVLTHGFYYHHDYQKQLLQLLTSSGKVSYPVQNSFREEYQYLISLCEEEAVKCFIISFIDVFEAVYKNYESTDQCLQDIIDCYRSMIRDFYDLGCRYIQLTDAHLNYLQAADQKWVGMVFEEVFKGKPSDLCVVIDFLNDDELTVETIEFFNQFRFIDGFQFSLYDNGEMLSYFNRQKLIISNLDEKTLPLAEVLKEISENISLKQICLCVNTLIEDNQENWRQIYKLANYANQYLD